MIETVTKVNGPKAGATFSVDERYRYQLWRGWEGESKGTVLWIMLNPSTADHEVLDPTIRRCVDFTKRWGYGGLEVVNLFALRSPMPKALRDAKASGVDPVGPDNDLFIENLAREATLVVIAWGTHGSWWDRDREVLKLVGDYPLCLGTTRNGHPQHPLYVPGKREPELYSA